MAPRKSGCLRWLLGLLAASIIFYVLAVPTIGVLAARSRLVSAVASATSIRLEAYEADRILKAHALDSAEFSQVIEALPAAWDYGMPGLARLCFVPRHRIVITDARTHSTAIFRVCFNCDQVDFTTGILNAPSSWHQPLRQLFLRHDISIDED